jgi:hypothetical protein
MLNRLLLNFSKQLFLFFMIIASCKSPTLEGELPTILITDRIDSGIYLSDLTKSMIVIQLETNEHALLGVIKDIKFYNDRFYINDSNQILVFDNKGKFLSKLGNQGGGPGEYGIVYSMDIDSHSNLIYVSSVRKLIVFSTNHKLIKEKNFQFLLPYIKVVENNLLIISDEIVGEFGDGFTNNTSLYELSSDLIIKDSSIVRKVIIDENRSIGNNFKFFISNYESSYYFYKPVLTQESIFPDTLYHLDGVKVMPNKKIIFEKSQMLDSDGIMTPLMLNVISSTNYIICEYYLDGEQMLLH